MSKRRNSRIRSDLVIGKALKALPVDADDLVVDVDSSVDSRCASLRDRLDEDPGQLSSLANVTYDQ